MFTNRPVYLAEAAAVKAADTPNATPLTVESIDNHVYFYADVDSDRCLALIRAIQQIDAQLRNERLSRHIPDDHPQTPIWLHIQSYGGYLFSGLAMIDQLAKIHTPIYSIIEGVSASAATLISMGCQKRYILRNSFMLIHQLRSFVWGTHEEIKDEAKLNDMLMGKLIDFYETRTKLDRQQVEELLKRESWMDSDTCLERGFVDGVL